MYSTCALNDDVNVYAADKEALSAQLVQVAKERDQAMDDIGTVEASFTQLHQRYEKLKGTVDAFKQVQNSKWMLQYDSRLFVR